MCLHNTNGWAVPGGSFRAAYKSGILFWNCRSNLSSVPNPLSPEPFLQRPVRWSLLAAGWKQNTPSEKLNWRQGWEEWWQERSRSRKNSREMHFDWYKLTCTPRIDRLFFMKSYTKGQNRTFIWMYKAQCTNIHSILKECLCTFCKQH